MYYYKSVLFLFTIFNYCLATNEQLISVDNGNVSLSVTLIQGKLHLKLQRANVETLSGTIGTMVNNPSFHKSCKGVENCIEFEDDNSRLHIMTNVDEAFSVYWTTNNVTSILRDCFDLEGFHWYGGPERYVQKWPIEKLSLWYFANVPQQDQSGAVTEPYWLNSAGAYIFVDEKVPLFIIQNTLLIRNQVCFYAESAGPYSARKKMVLHYTIAALDNAREAHIHAVKHFLGKPTGHPDYRIIEKPIWSTWARYKRDISDATVLEFAKEIRDNGYTDGQFEIDDNWEECYGALQFNKSRFGNISSTVKNIKAMNFTVTLWTHPFVNLDCTEYSSIGRKYDIKGSDLTQWWNSGNQQAHHLDFTKAEVRLWFVERLRNLQKEHGIDSFKFDAGEATWLPQVSALSGDLELQPNNFVEDYVRMCAEFGRLIEVRSAWKTQDLPVFVRMLDKASRWDINNGLPTLITTLLQMNLNGYTMVLPDMVGGNGYNGRPSVELFVRWIQANVFMPSIQFSYVPWVYSDNKIDAKTITMKMVDLHRKFSPYIKRQMEKSIAIGYPVNAPIWWVDPNNEDALAEDTEFLLGEDVLVAPVIIEGATSRTINLPSGTWIDGNTGQQYHGPLIIEKYSASIEVLPYFIKNDSEAYAVHTGKLV